jgi:hypothetical protein
LLSKKKKYNHSHIRIHTARRTMESSIRKKQVCERRMTRKIAVKKLLHRMDQSHWRRGGKRASMNGSMGRIVYGRRGRNEKEVSKKGY